MMPKFYYFSENKLKFIEVRKNRLKSAIMGLLIVSALGIFLILGLQFFNILPTESKISAIRNENALLISKLQEVTEKYKVLDSDLDSLISVNNELRIAANLPPLQLEDRLLGKGGSTSNGLFDFLSLNNKREIQSSIEIINEVEKKFEFEKNNFSKIANTLKFNQELYKAIPAIKPASGTLALHGFGMRLHPILNIRRMHEGLDIITAVGTPVVVAADGKVIFVGKSGGYGLMVEVDHGFGYRTVYAHLSSALIREGQQLRRGTLIARTGNTGLSSGPHLHYEVIHDGIKLNPEDFIFESTELFIADNNSVKKDRK